MALLYEQMRRSRLLMGTFLKVFLSLAFLVLIACALKNFRRKLYVQFWTQGFTYYHFRNQSAKLAFDNETIKYLIRFKIFDEKHREARTTPISAKRLRFLAENLARKSVSLKKSWKTNTNRSRKSRDELIIVTASSSNHYLESLDMISSAQAAFAKIKLRIIFYDLGLENSQIRTVQSICSVEYRKFRFEDYPKNVAVLKEYRWKPIIWAEVFSHGSEIYSFMWADSSVRWKLDQVRSFLNVMLPQLLAKIDQQKMTPIVLFGPAWHSNFAVTDPVMMDFLPTDIQQQKTLMQREANIALVTRDHPNFVLKWHVLCALEPECMAPMTADINCLGFFWVWDKWTIQQCHRFDQSAINILLSNAAGFNDTLYTANNDFYEIARGGMDDYVPKKCIY